MILDLSSVFSEQHKPIDAKVECEMKNFKCRNSVFEIRESREANIHVAYAGDGKLIVEGDCYFIIDIPCDRCLEIVPTEFDLKFSHEISSIILDEVSEENDELDENNYIDGYHLDVDRLLYNEILVGWPMKVLCDDACKGICNVCGQNLNQGTCNCEDTGIDPRMSVIRDVFKNFKEV